MSSRAEPPAESARFGREAGEFDRVVAFGDAVFAVAITILVLGLEVPEITPETDVWAELVDIWPQFLAYLISFAVIGAYWVSNHRFVSRLDRVSYRYIAWNLGFLLGISLISFGTRFLGANNTSPGAIAVYASLIAYVSLMEGVGRTVAYNDALFRDPPPRHLHHFRVLTDCLPGIVFLVTIPIGFLIGPHAAYIWILIWPLMSLVRRFEPKGAEEMTD